jgi:RNA polymerase sigma factor (sigma-70 family)
VTPPGRDGGRGSEPPLPSLEELLPRHQAYVRTLVARLGVSPAHEREDLVQEVLIQAHRSRDSALEPRALLFGITRHVVFRWISRREHERGALKTRADEATEEPTAPSAEEERQELERRELVRDAVDELPDIFREVFVLCELGEVPMAEAAPRLLRAEGGEAIGVPVNTGYTRLLIARKRFAEAMARVLARRRLRAGDV